MEDVGPGSPAPVTGGLFPAVGETHVKPPLVGVFDFVSDVVIVLVVALRTFKFEMVGKGVAEMLKKVGMLVIDGKERVVRLDGRLLMISEGFTVGNDVTSTDPVGVKELVADSPVVGIIVSGVLVDRLVSCATDVISSDGVCVTEASGGDGLGISVMGTGSEILDVGSSDIKLVSTLVADIGTAEVSVKLPTALVITDTNEVSAGGKLTLPVMLYGTVRVGNEVGKGKLVSVVGNGKGNPPNIPSWRDVDRVWEADVVVF
jgi:hypothetical protein